MSFPHVSPTLYLGYGKRLLISETNFGLIGSSEIMKIRIVKEPPLFVDQNKPKYICF